MTGLMPGTYNMIAGKMVGDSTSDPVVVEVERAYGLTMTLPVRYSRIHCTQYMTNSDQHHF